VLDMRGIVIPKEALFDVEDAQGRILGRSADWQPALIDTQVSRQTPDGIYRVTLGHRHYRFTVVHATRIIDPNEKGGGKRRVVLVRYGASTGLLWHEVLEAVSSYAIASLLLLLSTGGILALILRRSLSPLGELAVEAGKISAQQWHFHPPASARAFTELAPLTLALEATLRRLERSFEQQRRFTSDAAHELKTDLAIAKSSLQLLAMRLRTPEQYMRGLEICLTDTLRLERTVSTMLTLARVEQSRAEAESATVVCDLALSLREVVRSFDTLAELRQVRVETEIPVVLMILLDADDARILCSNLLMNALQHSPARERVRVLLTEEGGFAKLRIEDRGPGIAPEALAHVFEPFYREDVSRNRSTGGTGLGLAICKGICDRIHGGISIESMPGAGTCVSACLPCAPRMQDSGLHSHLQPGLR
jgi:signal transduction histidine kinase